MSLLIASREMRSNRRAWAISTSLIATAVAALTVTSIAFRTAQLDEPERLRRVLGTADWRLDVRPTPDRLPGTPVTAGHTAFREGLAVLVAADGAERVRVTDIPLSNGLASGIVTLEEGRPPGPRDVALSRSLAKSLGVAIGDSVTFRAGSLEPLRVSGVVVNPYQTQENFAVVAADARGTVAPEASLSYSRLGLGARNLQQALRELADQAGTTADQVTVSTPLTVRDGTTDFTSQQSSTAITIAALALLQMALFIAAAFAIAVRRQRRVLGLLSAVGGTPRQLQAVLLTQGMIVAVVGTGLGLALGLVAARLAVPAFVRLGNQSYVGLVTNTSEIAGAAVAGFGLALLASIFPTVTVGRRSTNELLRDGLASPGAGRGNLSIGIVSLVLGSGLLTGQALSATKSDSLLVLSAGLLTLSFAALAPRVLDAAQRIQSLPLILRLGIRDAARNLSRVGPAVIVVIVTVASAVALTAFYATREQVEREGYKPEYRPDELQVIETAGGPAPQGPGKVVMLGVSRSDTPVRV